MYTDRVIYWSFKKHHVFRLNPLFFFLFKKCKNCLTQFSLTATYMITSIRQNVFVGNSAIKKNSTFKSCLR